MKVDDYKDIITSISNPDTMSEGLIMLNEQLKNDEMSFNKLMDSNNNLRDTNARLALRITSGVEVKEVEPTNEEIFENLFSSKFNSTLK